MSAPLRPGEFRAVCRRDYRVVTRKASCLPDSAPIANRTERTDPCDLTFTDRAAFERHMTEAHGAKPLANRVGRKTPDKWGPPSRRPFVPKDTDHDLLDWHGRVRPTELTEGDVFRYKGWVYDVEAVENGGLFLRMRPKKGAQEKRGLIPWERFGGDDVVERLTA